MSTTDRQAERISNSRRVAEEALKSGDDFPEFIETLTPKELGYLGEALACSYLEERGLEVVERQYRCREGEADIIAHDLDSDEFVLVEVKTRRASRSSTIDIYPEEAVDERKRLRYARIASCYVMEHYPVTSLRFDIIAITLLSGGAARITHVQDAFEWDAQR